MVIYKKFLYWYLTNMKLIYIICIKERSIKFSNHLILLSLKRNFTPRENSIQLPVCPSGASPFSDRAFAFCLFWHKFCN